MQIGIPKELSNNETRTPVTPGVVKSYVKFGFNVVVESGAGNTSYISDDNLKEAGAQIAMSVSEVYQSDIILKVNAPTDDEINQFKEGSLLISFIQTTKEIDTVKNLKAKKINISKIK